MSQLAALIIISKSRVWIDHMLSLPELRTPCQTLSVQVKRGWPGLLADRGAAPPARIGHCGPHGKCQELRHEQIKLFLVSSCALSAFRTYNVSTTKQKLNQSSGPPGPQGSSRKQTLATWRSISCGGNPCTNKHCGNLQSYARTATSSCSHYIMTYPSEHDGLLNMAT